MTMAHSPQTLQFGHTVPTVSTTTPIHFIGVGGIGMSGLAQVLLEAGVSVSGSDNQANANTQRLQALGATITVPQQATNVPANALVVLSTAIAPNNPERQQSERLGLPTVHRADMLAQILHGPLLNHQQTVGITGTHGKTTITGMLGMALLAANSNPTVVAGGLLPGLQTNAVLGQCNAQGQRPIAVAELDESDQSLTCYRPTHSVISNIELDHADHYPGGLAQIIEVFNTYLQQLPTGAQVFVNADCPNTRLLLDKWPTHVQAVWLSVNTTAPDKPASPNNGPYYTVTDACETAEGYQSASIACDGLPVATLHLSVPGQFNLFNAMAALAVAHQLGVSLTPVVEALNGFTGMGRRFERLKTINGACLVDDYGHHPTEIMATLAGTKALCHANTSGKTGRVMVVFQPHRYSRLKALWPQFIAAFDNADAVWITDVYGAGEGPEAGPDSETFAKAITHPNVTYLPKADWPLFVANLPQQLQAGDIMLSMGAGDITQLFRG
jgi:UDP-N-acetylmuramate--alanine ligase